jgi:hypothetical protein
MIITDIICMFGLSPFNSKFGEVISHSLFQFSINIYTIFIQNTGQAYDHKDGGRYCKAKYE